MAVICMSQVVAIHYCIPVFFGKKVTRATDFFPCKKMNLKEKCFGRRDPFEETGLKEPL
jgi:hypothetical protein